MNRLKLCFITLLCVLPLFGSMAQSVKLRVRFEILKQMNYCRVLM